MNWYCCFCLPGHSKAVSYPHSENCTWKKSVIHCLPCGGGSSWTIMSRTYHIVDKIFKGAPIQKICNEVFRCWSLNCIRRNLGVFVFNPNPPLLDRVLLIPFRHFSLTDLAKEYLKVVDISKILSTISITKYFCSQKYSSSTRLL